MLTKVKFYCLKLLIEDCCSRKIPWQKQNKVSSNLWINCLINNFHTLQMDSWYCDEPVEPESGQYPTLQMKIKICPFKFQNVINKIQSCRSTSLVANFNISNRLLIMWWTSGAWEWPVRYIIQKCQIWLFGIGNWRLSLQNDLYMNQSWGSTSKLDCITWSVLGKLMKNCCWELDWIGSIQMTE